MRLPGKRILVALGFSGGLLASCQPLAQKAGLEPVVVPASASCASQVSFEQPMTLEDWDAPSWSGGFDSWALDSSTAYCGARSLRVRGAYTQGSTTNYVVINHLFTSQKNLQGKTLTLRVFMPQTPPAGFRFTVSVLNEVLDWAGSIQRLSMTQGWNTITLTMPSAAFQKAAGIHFETQLTGGTPASYQTDLWIDEVNW